MISYSVNKLAQLYLTLLFLLFFSVYPFYYVEVKPWYYLEYEYLVFFVAFFSLVVLFFLVRVQVAFYIYLFSFIVITIISGFLSLSPSSFMYFLPMVFSVFVCSVWRNEKVLYNSRLNFNLVVFVSVAFSCLFFESTHGTRYSLSFIGDPNYSAAVLSFPAFALLTVSNGRLISFVCWAFLLFLVYMTESRMLLVALAGFIGFNLSLFFGFKPRVLLLVVLIAGVIFQPIFYYIFSVAGDLGFDIFLMDPSNMERVQSYMDALYISLSDFSFLYSGLGGYENIWLHYGDSIENVPHNWFIMNVISNGFLFAFFCFFTLFYLILKIDLRFVSLLSVLIVFSSILGRFALYSPFLFFSLFVFLYSRRMVR